MGLGRNAKVSDAISNGEWRFRRVRHQILQTLIDDIKTLPSGCTQDDVTLWRHGEDRYRNIFSSSHTWNQIRHPKNHVQWGKLLWFPLSIPRYSFIAWLAILNRLSTGSRSALWGAYNPCLFCGDRDESREHLFFACPYSFTIWYELGRPLIGPTINPDWQHTFDSLLKNRKNKNTNTLIRMLFQTCVYHIWRERNARLHNKPYAGTATTIASITRTIEHRLRAEQKTTGDTGLLQLWQTYRNGT